MIEEEAELFELSPETRERELLNEVLAAADCDLLLDLHNAYVSEVTGGLSLAGWLDALDLERVIEIHLAGGLESEPGWLPSGRRIRLDSHDDAVPAPVWTALESALPRCPRLRAVVLERHPDSLDADRLPGFEADVRRAREVVCSRR